MRSVLVRSTEGAMIPDASVGNEPWDIVPEAPRPLDAALARAGSPVEVDGSEGRTSESAGAVSPRVAITRDSSLPGCGSGTGLSSFGRCASGSPDLPGSAGMPSESACGFAVAIFVSAPGSFACDGSVFSSWLAWDAGSVPAASA